jgi:hypothetical protein
MSTLHVLLPPLAASAAIPALATWRSGDELPVAAPGRQSMLEGCFRTPGTTLPAAALTREWHAHDADGATWLCADPASVQPDLNGVRMIACGNLDLTAGESDALARELQPVFGDRGCLLEPTTPARWHLRLPAGAPVPAFDTPEQVLGDDLLQHLPQAPDARRWRLLLNEAQVILHQHPVNAARRRRGQLPANSLWLWGGGILPAWVKTPLVRVFSDDPLLQALAVQARIEVQPVAAFAASSVAAGDKVLLDLDAADNLDDRAAQLQAWLRRHHVDTLLLAFASGERCRVRRWHRWRFWRRPA